MTDENVFCNAQIRITCGMLINGCNTMFLCVPWCPKFYFFAVEPDFTRFGCMYTSDNLDKSRFPSAVFPHQCVDLTSSKLKIHIIKGFYSGKFFRYSCHLQNNIRHNATPVSVYLDQYHVKED